MSWVRAGDNSATHPVVMAVYDLADGDPGAVNEVFGFFMRLALQAASHSTDYVIDVGTAWMIGGSKTEWLLEIATKAGYLVPQRGKTRTWKLIDDPDFVHMRTRAEVEWEAQRKADNANTSLTVPVRLRDGDACRYCASIVKWTARRGKLAATYDHREAGHAATVATLVVCCTGCNAGRRDDPDADERYPLRDAPAEPFYSDSTAQWLGKHGQAVEPTPLRSAGSSRKPVGNQGFAAERLPAESGFVGSGRVGSGRSRSDQVGSARDRVGSGGATPRRKRRSA